MSLGHLAHFSQALPLELCVADRQNFIDHEDLRLEMRGDLFPTFLSGGMFRSIPWLAAEVTSRLREVAPRTSVSLLAAEPASGALALAMAEAAGGARVPTYLDAALQQS